MNYIKVLGASGSKGKGLNTTSFQIYKDIVVDAGNIINSLGDEAAFINHIFLTHTHADHISDLPFVIETFYEQRKTPLIIYGLKETIEILKKHSFNDVVWPDFTKIKLLGSEEYSLILKPIELNEEIKLHNYTIKAISANHIEGSCGYVISKNNNAFLITGDTFLNQALVDELNNNEEVRALLIECSFPDSMNGLAKASKHLTPFYINELLKDLKRNNLLVFYYHLKPVYIERLKVDMHTHNLFRFNGKILLEGDVIHIDNGFVEQNMITQDIFEEIMKVNLALSSETNKDILLEKILTLTKRITKADGGTLYIKSRDEQRLEFKVVQNDTLNIRLGGTGAKLNWPDLPIYKEDGSLNNQMVAVVCSNEKRIININDVYTTTKYKFDGTKEFDKKTSYRSKSMLVIPLINHEDEVIGVLQLINKKAHHEILNFNKFDEKIIQALASQAAMALINTQLIISLEEFINAFVSTIAKAIDAKSPYTSDHIEKVKKIALLIAEAINDDNTIYKNVKYGHNHYKQFALAALIHDIGKISMPDHVIDKATKLQKICDRIDLIEQRFEIIKKDKEIEFLKNEISKENYEFTIRKLDSDLEFLKKLNFGSEFMEKDDFKRLEEISKLKYQQKGIQHNLITPDEFYNLSIERGTLNKEEVEIIKNHAKLSLDMISGLPFPKRYKDVLNIACNHHEKLNGKGYPRGLSEKEIALEDRVMILADVFEALTASARPYKKAMKLSEVYKILMNMANKNEIDKDLVEFFFNHKNLYTYCNSQLKEEQIDFKK